MRFWRFTRFFFLFFPAPFFHAFSSLLLLSPFCAPIRKLVAVFLSSLWETREQVVASHFACSCHGIITGITAVHHTRRWLQLQLRFNSFCFSLKHFLFSYCIILNFPVRPHSSAMNGFCRINFPLVFTILLLLVFLWNYVAAVGEILICEAE